MVSLSSRRLLLADIISLSCFRIFASTERHVGNLLGWALYRKQKRAGGGQVDKTEERALVEKAVGAITEHCSKARVVVMVHLQCSPDTTLRRRRKDPQNRGRLPMEQEGPECDELHGVLDATVKRHLLDALDIPTLLVDNSQDGEDSMNETAAQIVTFIHSNLWRCAMHSS